MRISSSVSTRCLSEHTHFTLHTQACAPPRSWWPEGCTNSRSDQELMRLGLLKLSAIGALVLLPVRWLLLQPKRACQDQLADTHEWRSGRLICTVGHSASQATKELEHWARGLFPSLSSFLFLVGREGGLKIHGGPCHTRIWLGVKV